MASETINYETDCTICYEEMKEINISTTECGHKFHTSCLIKSAFIKNACPYCRKSLTGTIEASDLSIQWQTIAIGEWNHTSLNRGYNNTLTRSMGAFGPGPEGLEEPEGPDLH